MTEQQKITQAVKRLTIDGRRCSKCLTTMKYVCGVEWCRHCHVKKCTRGGEAKRARLKTQRSVKSDTKSDTQGFT